MRSGGCPPGSGLVSGPVTGASRVVVNSPPMATPVLPGTGRHFRARSGSFGAAEEGVLPGKLQGASQKEEGEVTEEVKWCRKLWWKWSRSVVVEQGGWGGSGCLIGNGDGWLDEWFGRTECGYCDVLGKDSLRGFDLNGGCGECLGIDEIWGLTHGFGG